MAAATLRACAGENGYSPDGRVPVAHNKNKSTESTAQITISSGKPEAIISIFSQRQLYVPTLSDSVGSTRCRHARLGSH